MYEKKEYADLKQCFKNQTRDHLVIHSSYGSIGSTMNETTNKEINQVKKFKCKK